MCMYIYISPDRSYTSVPTCGKCQLQHTATRYNTLQHTAAHCNPLQHTVKHCNTLQHTAPSPDRSYTSVLAAGKCQVQRTAAPCNTLATHCNTLAALGCTFAGSIYMYICIYIYTTCIYYIYIYVCCIVYLRIGRRGHIG